MSERGLTGKNRQRNGAGSRLRLAAALIGSSFLGQGLMVAMPAIAHAQQAGAETSMRFVIPAQNIASAVDAFTRISGWQIGYSSQVARSATTRAISGTMTPARALQEMLAGTDIRIRITGPSSAALVNNAEITAAGIDGNDPSVLETIVLESQSQDPGVGFGGSLRTDRYVAKSSSVGTKIDTDLRKVPQSVAAVSLKEIEDRKVQSLVDAVTYQSGVRTGVFGFDPRFDTVHVRGFDVTNLGFYRDGLRDLNGRFAVFRKEPYGLEGVTVLKGPSSALYGGGSPGGLVNVVSKRPTETPFNEIEGQLGNHERRQVNFDTSGPVGDSDNVLYRLTGLFRKADTEFVAARNDRIYIAPSLTLRSDDRNTHLTILGEYTDITTGGAAGYYSENGKITEWEQGDPAWGDFRQKQWRAGYEFEHRFNDNVAVRQNLRYSSVDVDARWTSIYLVFPGRTNSLRIANQILNPSKIFDVDNHVQLNFDLGQTKHTALVGLDYNYINSDYGYGYSIADFFDLVNKPYGKNPIQGPGSMNSDKYITKQKQVGIYAQDQVEFGNFVLTAGARYDWVSGNIRRFNTLFSPTAAATFDQKHGDFTGRVGLTYLFDNGFSPYASYSTSFAQEPGLTAYGKPYEPSEGEQYEIGFKYAPTDLNLSVNAALFHIEQSNVVVNFEADPYKFDQLGKVRSRGFEVSTTAGLASGLDLTAAYTYLDMEITEGTDKTTGKIPSGIPQHQFTLWANYAVQSGLAEGLNLGAGMRYYGKTWGDDENTIRNDARTLFDAALSYDFGSRNPDLKGLTAQINVKNVFDDRSVTCATKVCYREERRNVIGSLRYRF